MAPIDGRGGAVALVLAVVAPAWAEVTASGSVRDLEGCYHPDEPRRFQRHVAKAIRISGDLPRAWADSPALARAWAQQIIAALRWIWLNYGTPTAALAHSRRTGRFNSSPRAGTHDTSTRDPFRRCPVAGSIGYRDSFGARRTVGGYHPHWGNDIVAPSGRAIVAPFDGYAVAGATTGSRVCT